jgi:hypothetical protein
MTTYVHPDDAKFLLHIRFEVDEVIVTEFQV